MTELDLIIYPDQVLLIVTVNSQPQTIRDRPGAPTRVKGNLHYRQGAHTDMGHLLQTGVPTTDRGHPLQTGIPTYKGLLKTRGPYRQDSQGAHIYKEPIQASSP